MTSLFYNKRLINEFEKEGHSFEIGSVSHLENIMNKFANMGLNEFSVVKPVIVERKMEVDLMIDVKIYEVMKSKRPDLLMYLLPWCSNTRIIERKINTKIKYPILNGEEVDSTCEYVLDNVTMGNVWFHKLYTINADYEGFAKCEILGSGNFAFELPGSRESLIDGQFKIVVDAVLAVDAMLEGEDPANEKKILVVGCSSWGGTLSGLAYEVIATMVQNTQFHMYDPNTVNVNYVIGTNQFFHYCGKYNYNNVHDYDLVLDDAWVRDKNHEEIDPCNAVYECANFSVKKYPWEKSVGNIYRQVFRTDAKEQRAVSRNIVYDYKSVPIGSCLACVELKYLLKGKYDPLTYEAIMHAHKRNCKTGESRMFDIEEPVSVVMKKVKAIPSRVKKKAMILPWDLNLIDEGVKILTLNYGTLRGAIIKVSDEKFCTNLVLKLAALIIKEDNTGIHVIGNLDDFGLESANERKEKMIVRKLPITSMSKKKLADSQGIVVDMDSTLDFEIKQSDKEEELVTCSILFRGDVIGLGFRQYLQRGANEIGLFGWTENVGLECCCEIAGKRSACNQFLEWLRKVKPPLVRINKMEYYVKEYIEFEDFKVV